MLLFYRARNPDSALNSCLQCYAHPPASTHCVCHAFCRSMPAAWRGVRDEKLSEVSGIPGGVFVHAGGFIGGNATYEGVLEMARKSLVLE